MGTRKGWESSQLRLARVLMVRVLERARERTVTPSPRLCSVGDGESLNAPGQSNDVGSAVW